jgi:predicted acetyltransferase
LIDIRSARYNRRISAHSSNVITLPDSGRAGGQLSPVHRGSVFSRRRQLAAGLTEARRLGLSRVLLTCDPENEASRRTIVNNGGELDEQLGAELRYWIDLEQERR